MNYGKSTTVYTEQVIHSLFSLSRKKEIETKTVTLCHGMQTETRGQIKRRKWILSLTLVAARQGSCGRQSETRFL